MELRHLRHEVDNLIGALTLVIAGAGVSFCTTSMPERWKEIAFRPVRSAIQIRHAVAYRRDLNSPTVAAFLKLVRQVARTNRFSF